MTQEHEIAKEIAGRWPQIPGEHAIVREFGIRAERAGKALEKAKDIATMRALSYFGGASFEPVQEWQR